MGHVLYLDSLINAVVYARDRFLKPHGLILPDRAELYCVAANDTMAATKYSFWHDVYGFDMEPIQRDLPNIAKFHPVPGDKVRETNFKIPFSSCFYTLLLRTIIRHSVFSIISF
jgi:hypothetical protein